MWCDEGRGEWSKSTKIVFADQNKKKSQSNWARSGDGHGCSHNNSQTESWWKRERKDGVGGWRGEVYCPCEVVQGSSRAVKYHVSLSSSPESQPGWEEMYGGYSDLVTEPWGEDQWCWQSAPHPPRLVLVLKVLMFFTVPVPLQTAWPVFPPATSPYWRCVWAARISRLGRPGASPGTSSTPSELTASSELHLPPQSPLLTRHWGGWPGSQIPPFWDLAVSCSS